jgi:hypothetical protein
MAESADSRPDGTAPGVSIMLGMEEPPELQQLSHWRMAVWALRVGFLGLAVAIVGVIVLSSGSTPWVLAVGVMIWLVCAAVTVTGVFSAQHELPEPRPGLWSLRFMLLHDVVRTRTPAEPSR